MKVRGSELLLDNEKFSIKTKNVELNGGKIVIGKSGELKIG